MSTKATPPPPAYFLSLSLENVRSFGEKQTIYFTEGGKPDGKPAQWTIILGDNGVGKTTVLKALVALAPTATTEVRDIFIVPNKDFDIGNVYFNSYQNYLMDKWEPFREREKYSILDCYVQSGESLTSTQLKISIDKLFFRVNYRHTSSGKEGDVPRGLICYGYGAGRAVGSSNLTNYQQSNSEWISLFDDRADLLNPEEWFLQIDYAAKVADDNKGLILRRKLVENALLNVLPDIEGIQIDYIADNHKQGIVLKFKTPYGWVRLRDMSLGYQTLVVWLTDFASKLFIRYPDSPNPLEEPAIVLIDEIDLHLHPSWQRKLIGFLSGIFKNTQFIATAHSPLVVQAAGDQPGGANVVLLRRENDQTIVSQNPVDVRGWCVDQILTSTFFNLETARSLETEKKLERQAALLNKEKLTAKERAELDQLTRELDGQPLGSTDAEREEEEILRALTARLAEDKPGKRK